MRRIDLAGKRFGRLIVIRDVNGPGLSLCVCDCGKEKSIRRNHLKDGKIRSCGCLNSDVTAAKNKASATHGRSNTAEYTSWSSMKDRCTNKNVANFKYYGARGITVCNRWMDSFENFLADMGEKPSPAHSIDRKNVNGNYEPDNCRWATPTEQAQNKRPRAVSL